MEHGDGSEGVGTSAAVLVGLVTRGLVSTVLEFSAPMMCLKILGLFHGNQRHELVAVPYRPTYAMPAVPKPEWRLPGMLRGVAPDVSRECEPSFDLFQHHQQR